jgi:phosphatidylglycerophosphate synthase
MVNKLPEENECPFDSLLCKFIDGHLHLYYEAGLTPNMVTTFGIVIGLLAAYQISQRQFVLGALLWILSYYFDCIDGKLARKYNMVTNFGDLYDHICDIIKYIAVGYALYKSNKRKNMSSKQWIYFSIVIILLLVSFIHMGYQEIIYDKKEESGWLNVVAKIVSNDPNPERTINYTKYFGCGTQTLGIALIIILWSK